MHIARCTWLVASSEVLVAGEDGTQVRRRYVPPVHLAGPQCGRCRGGIGNRDPFDAVEMRRLRAGQKARLAFTRRHVTGKPLIDAAVADHVLGAQEAKGPTAHHVRHSLEGIRGRQALGHDARHENGAAGQRLGKMRERLLQPEHDGLVVGRGELVGHAHQQLTEPVAGTEAADAGGDIPTADRLAVMEAQAAAEFDGPAPPVVLDRMTRGHLGTDGEALVEAVERVEHEVTVIARRSGTGPHRVENDQVGIGHEPQDLRSVRPHGARGCEQSKSGGGGSQDAAAPHWVLATDSGRSRHQPVAKSP